MDAKKETDMRLGVWAFLCAWSVCFGMSLEERVGQVLMVHFRGEEVNEEARLLIEDAKVGGIIYYRWANGMDLPEQVRALSAGLQALARGCGSVPLLISTDQEGGVVARLGSGFTEFPGNRALGATGDPSFAERAALAMGEELRAVGVNMNLAPVVDVNSNPRNPVIGVRSFGESPGEVIAFGNSALEGFRRAGVIATLKHFPGYGDVSVDPHEDLPVIRKSKRELEEVELVPFAQLAQSADAIMTAHILVPALDEEKCSTLSKKTLDYLREEIGFKGVIVSDSLVMEGVLNRCSSVDEAAIEALNAGCDLLILGGKLLGGERGGYELTAADILQIHGSIVEAVKTGRILESRLNEAVERILKLKQTYCADEIELKKHDELASEIAAKALKVKENNPGVKPLSGKRIFVVGPKLLRDKAFAVDGEAFFYEGLNPSEEEVEMAKMMAQEADVVIVYSYNAWKNPNAVKLTRSLMDKPMILLCLRDPEDAALFPDADLIYTSFSASVCSIQAILNHLSSGDKK